MANEGESKISQENDDIIWKFDTEWNYPDTFPDELKFDWIMPKKKSFIEHNFFELLKRTGKNIPEEFNIVGITKWRDLEPFFRDVFLKLQPKKKDDWPLPIIINMLFVGLICNLNNTLKDPTEEKINQLAKIIDTIRKQNSFIDPKLLDATKDWWRIGGGDRRFVSAELEEMSAERLEIFSMKRALYKTDNIEMGKCCGKFLLFLLFLHENNIDPKGLIDLCIESVRRKFFMNAYQHVDDYIFFLKYGPYVFKNNNHTFLGNKWKIFSKNDITKRSKIAIYTSESPHILSGVSADAKVRWGIFTAGNNVLSKSELTENGMFLKAYYLVFEMLKERQKQYSDYKIWILELFNEWRIQALFGEKLKTWPSNGVVPSQYILYSIIYDNINKLFQVEVKEIFLNKLKKKYRNPNENNKTWQVPDIDALIEYTPSLEFTEKLKKMKEEIKVEGKIKELNYDLEGRYICDDECYFSECKLTHTQCEFPKFAKGKCFKYDEEYTSTCNNIPVNFDKLFCQKKYLEREKKILEEEIPKYKIEPEDVQQKNLNIIQEISKLIKKRIKDDEHPNMQQILEKTKEMKSLEKAKKYILVKEKRRELSNYLQSFGINSATRIKIIAKLTTYHNNLFEIEKFNQLLIQLRLNRERNNHVDRQMRNVTYKKEKGKLLGGRRSKKNIGKNQKRKKGNIRILKKYKYSKKKGGHQKNASRKVGKCRLEQMEIPYSDIDNGVIKLGDKVYVKGIGDTGLWTITKIVKPNAYDPKWGIEIMKNKEYIFLSSGDLLHENKRICKPKSRRWKRGGKRKKTKKNKSKR